MATYLTRTTITNGLLIFALALGGCSSTGDSGGTRALRDGGADASTIDSSPPTKDASTDSVKVLGDAGPPLSAVGVLCKSDAECGSGSCVDDVCCSSSACGSCQSCSIPGSFGTCAPLPRLSVDPKGACGDGRCDGAGQCVLATGNYCRTSADCVTGFCVDGVCCESACNKQCYSCAQLAKFGQCLPLKAGIDTTGEATCDDEWNECAIPAGSNLPACKLAEHAPCSSDDECAYGRCRTYYADDDLDGYGRTDDFIKECNLLPFAPGGYSTVGGDCCDVDPLAHPGMTATFSIPDVCGSIDYGCSGVPAK
jgi:hypothetical protein